MATLADIERIAATVSGSLPPEVLVSTQRRNGYIAVDLYRGKGTSWAPMRMVDTLTIGTKREVYTYLQGMRRAQLLTT